MSGQGIHHLMTVPVSLDNSHVRQTSRHKMTRKFRGYATDAFNFSHHFAQVFGVQSKGGVKLSPWFASQNKGLSVVFDHNSKVYSMGQPRHLYKTATLIRFPPWTFPFSNNSSLANTGFAL